jgi:hypothetical protein
MKNDRIKNDRIKSDRMKSGRIKSDRLKTDRIKRITDPISTILIAFVYTKKVNNRSFVKTRIRIQIRSQTSGSRSDQNGLDPQQMFRIE